MVRVHAQAAAPGAVAAHPVEARLQHARRAVVRRGRLGDGAGPVGLPEVADDLEAVAQVFESCCGRIDVGVNIPIRVKQDPIMTTLLAFRLARTPDPCI